MHNRSTSATLSIFVFLFQLSTFLSLLLYFSVRLLAGFKKATNQDTDIRTSVMKETCMNYKKTTYLLLNVNIFSLITLALCALMRCLRSALRMIKIGGVHTCIHICVRVSRCLCLHTYS